MLEIKGLQKTSLIDYPEKVSCVVFFGSCDFKCPFCQNKDLVLSPNKLETIKEDEFFGFLEKRKDWIEGVVISGGEPTIYGEELILFIKKIKKLGYLVKLDTNGSNPDLTKRLIGEKMVDFIAMDIKTSPKKYSKAANVPVDISKIEKSIEIIKNSRIDYEFRTTVVPGLVEKEDIEEIGKWLEGSKKFVMQQFRAKGCIDTEFQKIKPYSRKEIEEFKEILKKDIKEVEMRS